MLTGTSTSSGSSSTSIVSSAFCPDSDRDPIVRHPPSSRCCGRLGDAASSSIGACTPQWCTRTPPRGGGVRDQYASREAPHENHGGERGAHGAAGRLPANHRLQNERRQPQAQDDEDDAHLLRRLLVLVNRVLQTGCRFHPFFGELLGRYPGGDGDERGHRTHEHQDQGGGEQRAATGRHDEPEQHEERRGQEKRDRKVNDDGMRRVPGRNRWKHLSPPR